MRDFRMILRCCKVSSMKLECVKPLFQLEDNIRETCNWSDLVHANGSYRNAKQRHNQRSGSGAITSSRYPSECLFNLGLGHVCDFSRPRDHWLHKYSPIISIRRGGVRFGRTGVKCSISNLTCFILVWNLDSHRHTQPRRPDRHLNCMPS